MASPKQSIPTSILIILPFCVIFFYFAPTIQSQSPIPAKYDGFVYKNRPASTDTVIIDAFLDPVCPDSRDSWPPLKLALDHYGPSVSLIVHPFSLPYHDNSFIASRALHIVNKINSSATYNLLEMFFSHQEKFYNAQTFNMSRASVVEQISKLAVKAVGNSHYSDIKSGFSDTESNLATRVSFKYGCSRGVFGTPFFYVNGFLLPDGGSPINYDKWRSIIDPLDGTKMQDPVYFF